jgi:23S rRNA pseudouridine1911/1915/1917 synthase
MAIEDIALDVLYEDDYLLAVDKPAGVVVHPSYKNTSGTLLDAMRSYACDWPSTQRPSIVGRLDKLTSGVVVVAKTAAVHAALQRAPAEKDYLAVVYGNVTVPRGEIDVPLCHDPADRRMIVVSRSMAGARGPREAPEGSEAEPSRRVRASGGGAPRAVEKITHSVTRFERLASVEAPRAGLSLLRCRLITGRRHQIRVHLAASGWPIVGDPQYGEPRWSDVDDPALAATLQAFPRQALHAWRVAFAHPATRDPLVIHAPVPRDLARLLDAAGLGAHL